MNLIELSNWEWLIIVCLLIILVWILVVFQISQRSSHDVELTAHMDQKEERISNSEKHT